MNKRNRIKEQLEKMNLMHWQRLHIQCQMSENKRQKKKQSGGGNQTGYICQKKGIEGGQTR